MVGEREGHQKRGNRFPSFLFLLPRVVRAGASPRALFCPATGTTVSVVVLVFLRLGFSCRSSGRATREITSNDTYRPTRIGFERRWDILEGKLEKRSNLTTEENATKQKGSLLTTLSPFSCFSSVPAGYVSSTILTPSLKFRSPISVVCSLNNFSNFVNHSLVTFQIKPPFVVHSYSRNHPLFS